jgi:putative flippase GtrA
MRELLTHPTLRRFVRFAVVGASSTAIDLGLFYLLVTEWGWQTRPLLLAAKSLSFGLGVTNGFLWNRWWTFQATEGHAPTQYLKFVLVNLVGLALDNLVVQVAFAVGRSWLPLKPLTLVAGLLAIPPVALWNFTAHSLWTFAEKASPPTALETTANARDTEKES